MGLGNIFGGSKAKGIDTSGMNKIINDTSAQKKQLITGLNPHLTPLMDQYQEGQTADMTKTTDERNALSKTFLDNLTSTTNAKNNEIYRSTAEKIKSELPGQQENIREQLAATGGLQRGASAAALIQSATDNSRAVTDSATQIGISQMQAKEDALSKVYGMDESFLREKLGMTREDAATLLNSGRTDLINEFMNLLGEADQTGADKLGSEQLRQSSQQAADIANNQNRMAVINAIIGAGGAVAGGAYGKAAAAGKTGVVATQ